MNLRISAILVLVMGIVLTGCGQEPVSEATLTPTISASPTTTPLPSPTLTPTLTPSPTPIPEPDAKAMIAWKELGFSSKFIAFPPDAIGIEEGANAFSLQAADGSILEYKIAGSFFFADGKEPTQLIYGYTVLLPSSKDVDTFDKFTQAGLVDFLAGGLKVPVASVTPLANTKDIGSASGGVTTQMHANGTILKISMVAFRVGGIGSFVFVRNKSDLDSPTSVDQVARVYAKSIQVPTKYCRIASVSPVEKAFWYPHSNLKRRASTLRKGAIYFSVGTFFSGIKPKPP